MAGRQWGLLCPDGHGVLIERDDWSRQGVVWCAHEDHGGNGRFYRRQEVSEGYHDPNAHHAKTEAQIEREAKAAALEQQRKEMAMTEKTPEPKAPRERKQKVPQECTCGCGGMTKGGRFIPGHDARYHSRIAREAAEAALKEEAAEPETF